MDWSYGEENAPENIKRISDLVKRCEIVIDIHNSCLNNYLLITSPRNEKDLEYVNDVLLKISEKENIYDSFLGPSYERLGKGIFKCKNKKTITTYAAENDVANLVLEVPVFKDNFELRDFDMLSTLNSQFLGFAVKHFRKTYGGNKNAIRN